MKKLVSALTVGAIIAGAAFADVSIGLNFRQRANFLSHKFAVGEKPASSAILATDGYNGNGNDNLAIGLSGDIVSFNAQLVADQNVLGSIRAKSLNANVSLGKVQLFGGFWSDGKLDGTFRNKSDIDAGNMEGVDFEFKKLGSAYGKSPSKFVDNIVMNVNGNGENYALGGEWKVPSPKSVKFTLKGAYIANGSPSGAGASGKNSSGQLQGHTFSGLLNARAEHVTTELVFKYGERSGKKAMAFGLYAMPVTISGLTTTIGGAGSVIDGKFTDFSADLRLNYKAGALSISSFHSYSAIVDADNTVDLLGNATADKGIANGEGGSKLSRNGILSNNLMLRYKFNKTFAAYGFVADMIGFGKNGKKDAGQDNATIVQLRTGLYGQAYCGSSSISVGVVYALHDVTKAENKDAIGTLAVPVIFRVKM